MATKRKNLATLSRALMQLNKELEPLITREVCRSELGLSSSFVEGTIADMYLVLDYAEAMYKRNLRNEQ